MIRKGSGKQSKRPARLSPDRSEIGARLNKEPALKHRDVKALSLFFIDRIANYRNYDEDGNRHNGICANGTMRS